MIRASARLSRKWLRSAEGDGLRRTDGVLRTQLALAAAAAEEGYWRECEWRNASLVASSSRIKLCGLNESCWGSGLADSHSQGRTGLAADAATAAMGQLTLLDVEAMRAEEEAKAGSDAKETIVKAMEAEVKAQAEFEASNRTEAWPHEQARGLTTVLPEGAADESWRNASAWHTEWLMSLLEEVEDYAVGGEAELGRTVDVGSSAAAQVALQGAQIDDAEEEDDDRTLADLEVQVWLELDTLTNPDGLRGPQAEGTKVAAAFMTDGDVPDELLELLPPPPKGGWPDEFDLLKLAESRQARAKLNRLFAASDADAGPTQQPTGSAAQSTADLQLLGLASVGQPDDDDIFLPLADDSEEDDEWEAADEEGEGDDSEAAGAGGYPLRRRAVRLSYAISTSRTLTLTLHL